jgi:hypothetical protein
MSLDRLQGSQAVLHPYSDDHMGFVSQEIKEQGGLAHLCFHYLKLAAPSRRGFRRVGHDGDGQAPTWV